MMTDDPTKRALNILDRYARGDISAEAAVQRLKRAFTGRDDGVQTDRAAEQRQRQRNRRGDP